MAKQAKKKSRRADHEVVPYRVPLRNVSVNGILSAFYRTILEDRGITESMWLTKIERFIARSSTMKTMRAITSTRSNLIKELLRRSMTVKVWIKGLRIVGVRRLTFGVQLEWDDGEVTYHSQTTDLNDIAAALDEIDNEEADDE